VGRLAQSADVLVTIPTVFVHRLSLVYFTEDDLFLAFCNTAYTLYIYGSELHCNI